MASNYPGGYDTFSAIVDGYTQSMRNVEPRHSVRHNNVEDAIAAIQAELGLTPSSSYATVAARLDAMAAEIASSSGLAAHLADTSDAHDASAISFIATGGLSSTDVQAALAELDSEKSSTSHAHAASVITVDTSTFNLNLSAADNTVQKALETLDNLVASGFTAEDARDTIAAALVEGTGIDISVSDPSDTITITVDPSEFTAGSVPIAALAVDIATQAELDAHLNDITDAHDASAISYNGGTGMSATDVEAAIDELANEKADASALGNYLPLAGGTMVGDINMNSNDILNILQGTWVSGQREVVIDASMATPITVWSNTNQPYADTIIWPGMIEFATPPSAPDTRMYRAEAQVLSFDVGDLGDQTDWSILIGVGTNLEIMSSVVNVSTFLATLDDIVDESPYKHHIDAATTEDIALSGLQTIDGIALSESDLVLVKDQTDPIENGLYLASSGAWARQTTDIIGDLASLHPGFLYYCHTGTVNNDSFWVVSNDTHPTLDVDPITFTKVNSASFISYDGGTGISATNVEDALDELATEKANVSDLGNYLPLAGGTMAGDINMNLANSILNAEYITIDSNAGTYHHATPHGSIIYHESSGNKIFETGLTASLTNNKIYAGIEAWDVSPATPTSYFMDTLSAATPSGTVAVYGKNSIDFSSPYQTPVVKGLPDPTERTSAYTQNQYMKNAWSQRYSPAMRGWNIALNRVEDGSGKATIVFLGDSLTEWLGVSYAEKAALKLSNRYDARPYSDGFIPINRTLQEWTVSDGSLDLTSGLGAWGRALAASTSDTASHTANTVGFDLYYTKQPSGGSNLQIYIDNVLIETINTTDAGLSSNQSGYKWESSTLTWGSHEIEVVATGSGTAIVDGVYVHTVSRSIGIKAFNGGHAGLSATGFHTTYSGSLEHIAQNTPDCVTIMVGAIDYSEFSGNAASFKTSLASLVDAIRSRAQLCSIVLITEFSTQDRIFANYPAFKNAVRELAIEKRCAFLDADEIYGDVGSVSDLYGISADNTHITAASHYALAEAVYDLLVGGTMNRVSYALTDGSRDFTGDVTIRPGTGKHVLGDGSYSIYSGEFEDNPRFTMGTVFTLAVLGMGAGSSSAVDTYLFRTAAGVFSLNSTSRLRGLLTPTTSDEAAPKSYVDTVADTKANLISIISDSTTAYTLQLTDAGDYVRLNNASAITLTVPPNASVAFPIGTIIYIHQVGAGQVEVAQGVGVTVNTASTRFLRAEDSTAVLVKVATNEWDLFGDLEAAGISTGWSVTNEVSDKVLDTDSVTLDELADVVGTLIEVLKTYGILES